MKNGFQLLWALLLGLAASDTPAQHPEHRYVPDPDPAVQEKLEEWQDLKLGLLMHWGPYSQ